MKNKEEVKQIVLQLAQAAFDKKGRDIEILDLEGVSMLGDYFLIASANNIKQSQSIADEMEDKAAELGMTVNHREGYREGEWILLDFGDIICHVFGGDELSLIHIQMCIRDRFIISNTIRLTVFARRKEIAIMKYVGATNGFIRWPFLIEGMLLGLVGCRLFAFEKRVQRYEKS